MVRIGLELYSVSEISEFLISPLESRRDELSLKSSQSNLAEVELVLGKGSINYRL